ncbi:ribose 5-phosphate isomerase A [Ancylostoma ceylanicum]|uniref:Integrin beta n=1 Tax=Ancylostoma ceylanicum TaxID=53326 RepID=A0A0D6LX50_9BILA|nr:ribose 5-phosphate isomerase A [Ancylostoma ceylanicum]
MLGHVIPLLLVSATLAAEVSDWKTGDVTGEVVEGRKDFPCYSLSRDNYTCSACIQLHDSCAWCGAPLFDAKKQYARCDNRARLLEHGCPESYIEDPQTILEVEKDEPLSDKGQVENEDDAVQLKPQEMFVEIRPKSRVRFNVTYRQAVDYPVDLYYLMDLSYSMKDDKQKLSELGDLLAVRMRNITKNFRLGFGSFIDKKLMPFIDPRIEKQKSPCAEPCAEPYGFKHQMTLTTNTEKFKAEVDKAEISGNLDAPEGGFDAVVQALACNSKIGWRERARKMVVFSTDAGFHFAGDGRLAGVVEPNDGECHLDRDGYYTETLNQDYPSIALLHQMIKDRKANIIFAVTKGNHELYTQLSESLPDVSSSVGILETDSRNIVDLIEGEYLKISEKIIMVDNANASDGLKITYRSMCLDGTTLRDTNVCEGIRVGDEVQFEVTLEATHCVEKRDFVLRIGPSGLDETLIVNVKVLCDCDCEQEDRIVENAEECHGGDMVCGVCRCKGGNVGRYCECNRPGMSTAALNEKCKRTNESAICEGRGVCNCGRCECNPRQNPEEQISGEFCECDNFNCPRHDRKICAEHGECNCGQCICAPGWTGRACECPISQDSCMSANGKICNGKGECICGRCRCFDGPDGNRYSGAKCEICPTCPTKCIEYKPCVMCQQWGTGPYDEERCAECPFKVIPVEELPELNETTACQFVDPADDCTFYYLYYYDEATDNATVWVREHKDCPPPVPVLAIVLGVIAGIVILGLILLLVWKLLTVLHDRAEYAKFNNERLMAKWDTINRVNVAVLLRFALKDSLITLAQVRLLAATVRRMVSSTELSPIEKAKRQAAYTCAEKNITNGCRLGVGSGSTVKYLVEYLEVSVKSGKLQNIVCVPTSFLTKKWLLDAGLPVTDLDGTPELDVCIDGADEVVDSHFTCIKGGGGCLAREKIVQHAAKKFFVIADSSKESVNLGEHYNHIPIEVLPFAASSVMRSLPRTEGGTVQLRMATKKCGPVITDNNNYIIDWAFEKNKPRDWKEIQLRLANTPGIVETGLFIGVVDKVYFAYPDGMT